MSKCVQNANESNNLLAVLHVLSSFSAQEKQTDEAPETPTFRQDELSAVNELRDVFTLFENCGIYKSLQYSYNIH